MILHLLKGFKIGLEYLQPGKTNTKNGCSQGGVNKMHDSSISSGTLRVLCSQVGRKSVSLNPYGILDAPAPPPKQNNPTTTKQTSKLQKSSKRILTCCSGFGALLLLDLFVVDVFIDSLRSSHAQQAATC